jgi:hypothetical protein
MTAATHGPRVSSSAPAWIWLTLMLSVVAAATRGNAAAFDSVEIADSMTCRIVESAAALAGVPVSLLTHLVWTESRFHTNATSAAGAEGIAQFMPETAAERGLANPFDPEEAIPKAAELLADLELRFGNLGLAAAAYNAGPNRVGSWLAGTGRLAPETRAYVFTLTGRTVEDWAREPRKPVDDEEPANRQPCVAVIASLRAKEGARMLAVAPDLPFEGNFLTAVAITRFEEARRRYCLHFDAHWHRVRAIPFTRRVTVAPDELLLPPLCSTYLR